MLTVTTLDLQDRIGILSMKQNETIDYAGTVYWQPWSCSSGMETEPSSDPAGKA